MDEDDRVHTSLSDQPRRDHRLTERGRSRQHSSVMCQYCTCGSLLFGPQLPLECQCERMTRKPLVPDRRRYARVAEGFAQLLQASSWQPDVMRMVLGARYNPRLVVGRQTHRLGLVELRILKCRQSKQAGSEPRVQAVLGDVDLIAEYEFQPFRHSLDERTVLATSGRRCRPRFIEALLLRWQPHAENSATSFSLRDDALDILDAELVNTCEERPLIGPGLEVFINEGAVALFARPLLQRQCDQVAESALCGIVSWFGNKRSYESKPRSGQRSMVSVRR